MDNNLSKSLAALDAAADELLKKSTSDDTDKGDVKPDEVSQDNDVEKCDKPDGDNGLKKSDDNDDDKDKDADSDENADDSIDDEDTSKSLEDMQQDIMEDFKQDSDIANGAATSEFQAAMVAATAKSLGELQYDIYTNRNASNQVAEVMAKSFQAVIAANQQLRANNDKLARRLSKLEKSLDKGFGDILDAIDNLSTQPAHTRKSVGSINVHDKDFAKSVNGVSNNDFESLSKGQVMTILTNELYNNNPQVRTEDIVSYESGAPLRDDLKTLVVSKCK